MDREDSNIYTTCVISPLAMDLPVRGGTRKFFFPSF